MQDAGAAKMLEEIAVMLELRGENPFKSRAYYNASRLIAELGDAELARLVHEDKLKEMKGIGAALDEKLKELVHTGRLAYHAELKEATPEGLFEMLKVPGLGPRKVSAIYQALEITTLAELEYACRENRLVQLKGFGAKTQQNILSGIEFLRRHQGHYFYSEAKALAADLVEGLEACGYAKKISLAGSIRRCLEVVKNIDLVVSGAAPEILIDSFLALDLVESLIDRQEEKVTAELKGGINATAHFVEPEEYHFALQYYTGSKEHNLALKKEAKALGFTLSRAGLFKADKPVLVLEEEDVYRALKLAYIPPELREDRGEIEAARQNALPKLATASDLKGVFHIHTTYSDGSASLEEMIKASLALGYEYIGISDHSQAAFYAGGLSEDDLKRQEEEIFLWREKYPALTIFWGIESDIRPGGELDYPDHILEKFDFVIASVHSGLRMEKEKMTARLKRALEHPATTILGHPTNRILLGRESSPLDLEAVFAAAKKNEVILEFNANPARLDLDWRHLQRAKDLGLKIAINPDAHNVEGLNDTTLGLAVARKGWLERKDIFNAMDRFAMESYLNERKARY